jgi:diguanylate cyclase (GGDEF)-like protein
MCAPARVPRWGGFGAHFTGLLRGVPLLDCLAAIVLITPHVDRRDSAAPPPRPPSAPAERTPQADGVAAARTLRPEVALQLLEQSGHGPLPGTPGSDAWLQELIDALVDLSSRDALTGLNNRRSFELALSREIDRVARSGEPALLLTLDIDHFKRVNDTHGHAAGDLVIRAVGRALADTVRPMDLVARVGGEEFAIVLPNCPAAFGSQVAERIRTRVARQPVQIAPGEHVNVTVSVGGAFAPQWVRTTARLWMDRTDLQLYRAKSEGRNRCCLEPTAVSLVSAEEKGLLFASSTFQDLT